jgi:osmotically-inducible protein OsmY
VRSDREIQQAIEDHLQSDGNIDSTDVAVSVKDGVVMLAGFVRTYGQKVQAEADAKCVADVAGVANDVEVRLALVNRRSDPRIAREAVSAIQKVLRYSSANIQVIVKGNRVTLEGMLEWPYQKRRAEFVVGRLRSNRRVTNDLQVMQRLSSAQIKRSVEEQLQRSTDARQTAAAENGTAGALPGGVRSWAERNDIERYCTRSPV